MATLPVLPPLPAPIVIDIEDITTGALDGTGSFDKLMQASRIHLLEEYTKGRIDSSDYAQVYLGAMNHTIEQAMSFALTKDKVGMELQILAIQYQMAILNRDKTLAEIELIHSEIKVNTQQIAVAVAQENNLISENANIIKSGVKLDADIEATKQQTLLLVEQTDNARNDNGFRA